MGKTFIVVKTKLFVAFSHTLTEDQRKGWDQIVELKETNPDLHAQMVKIPADAGIEYIRDLAKRIVEEAVKVKATHFYCVGEPSLTFWANLYAGLSHWGNKLIKPLSDDPYHSIEGLILKNEMICVQATTERVSVETTQADGTVVKTNVFKHVKWRELF